MSIATDSRFSAQERPSLRLPLALRAASPSLSRLTGRALESLAWPLLGSALVAWLVLTWFRPPFGAVLGNNLPLADCVLTLHLLLMSGLVLYLGRGTRRAANLMDQFHEALESLPGCSVFLLDDRERILAANRQAEQTFGYTSAELRGQPLALVLPRWEPQPPSLDYQAVGSAC